MVCRVDGKGEILAQGAQGGAKGQFKGSERVCEGVWEEEGRRQVKEEGWRGRRE